MKRTDRTRGYSLYELLMTMGLVVVVMTLGIPAFGNIVANHRLRVDVDKLFHAAHLARKTSVSLRREVTLCPSTDGETCTPGRDWSTGWILFVNLDRDYPARRDDDEPLVRSIGVQPGNRIRSNRLTYSWRTTRLRATNGTLVFCDASGRARPRALVVSYTGRPRVAFRDRRGRLYACPD